MSWDGVLTVRPFCTIQSDVSAWRTPQPARLPQFRPGIPQKHRKIRRRRAGWDLVETRGDEASVVCCVIDDMQYHFASRHRPGAAADKIEGNNFLELALMGGITQGYVPIVNGSLRRPEITEWEWLSGGARSETVGPALQVRLEDL